MRASTEVSNDPPSPFLLARGLRANAYLDLAKTLTNYRLLALVLLLVDLSLVAVVVWQAAQTRIVPYVVRTDSYGNAVAFGPAERLADPDRALKVYDIARWVRNVRTVTSDSQVQRSLILDAYAYTDGRAVARLNGWFRSHPPFSRADRGTVSVQVSSVLAVPETRDAWQVQWRETELSPAGTVRSEQRWQALITLALDPPDRVEEVVTNPLGVYVTDFDWTRLPDGDDS